MSQKTKPKGKPRSTRTMAQQLSAAVQSHQDGELQRAETAYRQILGKQPENAEALHLLGVLMHQTGRDEMAEQLIQSAIKFDRSNDTYHFNLAEVQRATDHPQAAIHSYRQAINLQPGEADYYFGLGTALSDSGSPQEAIGNFREAILLAPHDPQIHNNLGNALAETGDLDGAIQHFHEAIRYDINYADAHANLANAQKEHGEPDDAIANYRKALSLEPDNADIHYNLALALDECEASEEALAGYRQAISLNPDMPEAHANLGHLLRERDNLADAEKSYRQALELNPDLHSALLGLASVYRDIGDFARAAECYRRAVEAAPEDASARTLLGDCLAKLDRYDEATEQIEKALSIEPENASAHFSLGTCLQAMGRFDAAAESHRRALTLQPKLAEAAYNLVLIDSKSLDDADLEKFARQSTDKALDENARINLNFALAKAYQDRGLYEDAFAQLSAGNDLKSRANPFNPEVYENYIERVIKTLNREFFDTHTSFGLDSEVPVFIVGMPRSGSTLVEQIISSHPRAHGAGELNDMRILTKRLPEILDSTREDPECLTEIPRDIAEQLASEHLQKLCDLSHGAGRVCDKMLGNFLKLGLIYLMFPRARIIHCMRNPLDTGLSCYFQNFARGLRFTYQLEHLGLAYRGYRKVMDHWREVLPMRMLNVQYEQLVTNQEQTSRELIEFCGLDWDERCLDFHRHPRGVKTASFWQVRQPLYNSSVGRWRAYEQQLAPLIDALGVLADETTDSAS